MARDPDNALHGIARYYSDKLAEFGETARGVDWNEEESQVVRFRQICKVIEPNIDSFSLNDLGCGYGALLDFLTVKYKTFMYLGVDISSEMIKAAARRTIKLENARFIQSHVPDKPADYTVASGIFNVRLTINDSDWFDQIQRTLDILNSMSTKAFAFNCLTSYSDEKKRKSYLYYAEPARLFDLCKRRYSREVSLLHDYGLYEFTMLVRK
jgi:SAM-dependent methyltransferase